MPNQPFRPIRRQRQRVVTEELDDRGHVQNPNRAAIAFLTENGRLSNSDSCSYVLLEQLHRQALLADVVADGFRPAAARIRTQLEIQTREHCVAMPTTVK